MGKTDKISVYQLVILTFLSLLSPVIRLMPRLPVLLGGRAAWLSPVPAAAVGLLYLLLMRGFLKNRQDGEGLGQLLERSVGKGTGKAAAVLCGLWMTIYAGVVLRTAAERLLSAVYGDGSTGWFIVLFAVIALVAAMGTTKSFARTVQLLLPVIVSVLVLVVVFSATEIKMEYLFPVTYLDAGAIALGAAPVIDIGSFSLFFAFLLGYTNRSREDKKHEVRGMLGIMFASLGVMVVTVGGCSAQLSLKLQNAFFTMIRNITVLGVVERVEALVVALWVITDLTLLAAVFMIMSEIWRGVFEVPRRRAFACPAAAASAIVAGIISRDAFELQWWSEAAVPAINLVFTFVLIPLLLVIGKLRKKI